MTQQSFAETKAYIGGTGADRTHAARSSAAISANVSTLSRLPRARANRMRADQRRDGIELRATHEATVVRGRLRPVATTVGPPNAPITSAADFIPHRLRIVRGHVNA